MDDLKLRIHLNISKYGTIFTTILNFIYKSNIYNLDVISDNNSIIYIELCESFFDTLIREITYHNYILMLDHNKYFQFISTILEKSIHLKSKECYNIDNAKQKLLCELINEDLNDYFEQLKNQIRMHIKINPLNHSIKDHSYVKVVSFEDLELNWKKKRSKKKSNSAYRIKYVGLPDIKMRVIYPKPPIIDDQGNIILQKNRLDI